MRAECLEPEEVFHHFLPSLPSFYRVSPRAAVRFSSPFFFVSPAALARATADLRRRFGNINSVQFVTEFFFVFYRVSPIGFSSFVY